ncbi:MAG: hypothetical protein GEEBNDBF_00654 [bacterium]|nr:hypothetical protein [bacterium]
MNDHVVPTAPLRMQHQELMARLEQQRAQLFVRDADSGQVINDICEFVRTSIAPRAAWEEETLYPAIDALMGPSDPFFTAVMRREHGLVAVWMQQLTGLLQGSWSDADQLKAVVEAGSMLAFIRSHFLVQEEVLLPILDQHLSAEEFASQVLASQPASLH